MDTGTHLVMGIALGGLATLDPVVAHSSYTATAVMIGTVLGSQAPDIDTVLKMRNNAVYIRNHRGMTHSIPFVLLWPVLITAAASLILPEANVLHTWLWTFLAVFLHVFVDIFNAYGTQAIRPLSSRWVALGIINTFDPFIFGIHIAGLILWAFGLPPGPTFVMVYIIVIGYYLARILEHRSIKELVRQKIPDARRIILSPTMRYHKWKIAVTTGDKYYVAVAENREISILDTFDRHPLPESRVLDAALQDVNLSAFVSFSPVYRWEISYENEMFTVRFIDLRYRSRGRYPFVAIVHLDDQLNILNSFTGWVFTEEKLQKKLNIITG
ncbi:membrane protein [Bacillus sp. FJAT-27916]|uniref:metal-dependent hydrolase n=1 Tax=Bacillaceae TaxID=186817 RepID=UPI0006714197|nr:metal-dependent hydrolase [Bacillus sp. FJAT-27916]KMY45634.1 membrane protein [Bacillus sp. FJAT-27916]